MASRTEHISAGPVSINHQNTVDATLKQLKYECDTWKRQLCFMREENVHLKTRLSEILKDGIADNLLEEIEFFQSRSTREDDIIGLLRNELAELDKLLVRGTFEDGTTKRIVDNKMKGLRHSITVSGEDFIKLKSELNSHILENI